MKESRLKDKILSIWDAYNFFWKRIILRVQCRLSIMDSKKTIEYVKMHHCSIARFGDGEFMLMLQNGSVGFQKKTAELANALEQVLCNDSPNLLICVPRFLNSTRGCNVEAKKHWRNWKLDFQRETVRVIRELAGPRYCFGDSLLSRPYMDYKSIFPLLMELWKDQDLIIVEGEKTCLGVANDLFSSSKSIKRIIAPATDAFDYYSEIMEGILSQWKGELVVLALGPTATVLASDLSKQGIQALDIGHIDIEYEWYRMGAKKKVAIPGKYVNEVKDGKQIPFCEDFTYKSQIIMKIGSSCAESEL